MKKLVSEIGAKACADIIKLHITLELSEYMDADHPAYSTLKEWMFTRKEWRELINLILSGSKDLMFLFNDTHSIEFGMQFNPGHVEIHSTCLNDMNLLNCLKQNISRETKVILGAGGSSLEEIENAIYAMDHHNIVLMFGFQNFPTKYKDINFSKMRKVMKLFPEFQFGYADHTAWDEPDNILITLFGAALGMDYIEKHVTTAYGEERVDWSAAVSVDMFNEIKEKLDLLSACDGNGLLKMNQGEKDYSVYGPMKKAAVANTDISAGQKINKNMYSFKRTKQVSDLSQTDVLENMGKMVQISLKKGQVLLKEHFAKEDKEG